jgi:hypothetical protein
VLVVLETMALGWVVRTWRGKKGVVVPMPTLPLMK